MKKNKKSRVKSAVCVALREAFKPFERRKRKMQRRCEAEEEEPSLPNA
jgi:hypothetical protein